MLSVSGLLKNLAEKSGVKSSSRKTVSDDENSCGDDDNKTNESDENSNKLKTKSILKHQKDIKPISKLNRKELKETDEVGCGGLLHLKSVLKKEKISSDKNENCQRNSSSSSDLHSILKTTSNKKDILSEANYNDDDSSASNDDSQCDNIDDGVNKKNNNKNLDIVNLLHKVEAEARISSNNDENAKNISSSDRLMNLKNLSDKQLSSSKNLRRKDSGDTSSEGNTSSSGGREIKKISNDAVARRRQAAIAKQAAER